MRVESIAKGRAGRNRSKEEWCEHGVAGPVKVAVT